MRKRDDTYKFVAVQTEIAPRDKKTYDNYKNLKKAARKALPSASGAINPNNLTALKKVLEAQKK